MVQFHAGFMTYMLMMIIGLVIVGIMDPPLFKEITDLISQLVRATRGG